jgi:translation elongation factor P/translation initiation factor 5A
MTGDKDKLLPICKIKTGNVIFENDEPSKIKGKAMVSLSNGKGNSQDVLLVDDLKHNLLSTSQMCDRGCEEVFMSKYCKVKNVNSGQVVAKGIRTDNDVDIESSHARKEEVEE